MAYPRSVLVRIGGVAGAGKPFNRPICDLQKNIGNLTNGPLVPLLKRNHI